MAKNSLVKSSIAFALAGSFALFPLIGVSPANAAPGGLCAVNSDYAEEDWITNLTLGNGTALAVAQGETYKDASAQSVGTYAAGTSNSISLTINVNIADQGGDDWDEHVFVWLDLNQNGVVDLAKEEIFEAHAMTSTLAQLEQIQTSWLTRSPARSQFLRMRTTERFMVAQCSSTSNQTERQSCVTPTRTLGTQE